VWRVVTAGTLDTIVLYVASATESAVSQVWLPRCAVTAHWELLSGSPGPGTCGVPRRSPVRRYVDASGCAPRARRGAGAPRAAGAAHRSRQKQNALITASPQPIAVRSYSRAASFWLYVINYAITGCGPSARTLRLSPCATHSYDTWLVGHRTRSSIDPLPSQHSEVQPRDSSSSKRCRAARRSLDLTCPWTKHGWAGAESPPLGNARPRRSLLAERHAIHRMP